MNAFEKLSEQLYGILSRPLRAKWSRMEGHIVQINQHLLTVYVFVPQENGDISTQTAELARLVETLLREEELFSLISHRQNCQIEEGKGLFSYFSFCLPLSVAEIGGDSYVI